MKLKSISFSAVYCSDTKRALQTAELLLEAKGQPHIRIHQDCRLREWCLGKLEAADNTSFISKVSDWLGAEPSLTELNQRLPEVAEAIRQHDTTGFAEPFGKIERRLVNSLAKAYMENRTDSNILIVTHAFIIKTLIYLFDHDNMAECAKVENARVLTQLAIVVISRL